MNPMSRTLATLCLLVFSAAALSSPPGGASAGPGGFVSTERALESISTALLLPTAVGGTLGLQTCTTCATERHPTDAQTRYLLGGVNVPLAAFAAAVTNSGPAAVTVYLDVRTHTVTRIVANLPPPARL
jgi:hypothetical protein